MLNFNSVHSSLYISGDKHESELVIAQNMVPVQVLLGLVIVSLSVELTKGDCTSCPSVPLDCFGNDGIYSYVMGTDTNGCSTITMYCTDSSGSSSSTSIISEQSVSV